MNEEIILVDKPAGMSSFGVVARVRRKLSEQAGTVEVKGKDGQVRQKRRKVKVGHTGTLDPFATGLLILLAGKATKRAGEFLKLDKEYIATIRLGQVSTTGDPEGEIQDYVAQEPVMSFSEPVSSSPVVTGTPHFVRSPLVAKSSDKEYNWFFGQHFLAYGCSQNGQTPNSIDTSSLLAHPAREAVERVLERFIGEIEQRVPQYSAVKINGERAYKMARKGESVEMPIRKVKIYELENLGYEWPELRIRCKVSSGTYIRALGEDIGKALGVGGYLTELRRTQVGEYRVEAARTLAELGG